MEVERLRVFSSGSRETHTWHARHNWVVRLLLQHALLLMFRYGDPTEELRPVTDKSSVQ